jgi:hypothetical protein
VPERGGLAIVSIMAPLADGEARGREFIGSLTGAQRSAAIIARRPPPDFATRMVPRIGSAELPDQGGGNHVHSVWRNPDNDFGDDILAARYRAEHG